MSNSNTNLQTQSSNALHNAIMEAGSKDRPPMLAPGSKTTTEGYMENYKNVSQDIRDQLNAEAEASHERLKQGKSINVQDLETNLYWEFRKFTSRDGESLLTSLQTNGKDLNSLPKTKKSIVTSFAPTYDPKPATVTEDDEMSKEKDIDKLMALISLSFKKIYKPTNNNLRTSSNTSRANQDNSPRINRGTGSKDNQDFSKPAIFSDSLAKKDFSKSKPVTTQNVSNDFSKIVTAQILPQNMLPIVKNTNVIAPGMYKVHTKPNQTRTPQLHQDIRVKPTTVSFSTEAMEIWFQERLHTKVYYIEGLNHNLFSVCRFLLSDLEVGFSKSTWYIRDLNGKYLLKAWLWHRRLSHLNFDTINLLSKNNIVNGLPKLKFVKDHLCSYCELVKAKRKSFTLIAEKTNTPSSKRRDDENLDKMKEKDDACIFNNRTRVFNNRTRIIAETIHVNFDELPQMASDHVSSDPGPRCSTTVLKQDSLSPGPQSQENVPQVTKTVTKSNELELLYSPMFSELLNGNYPVGSKVFFRCIAG
ncbi:integrase, catalytic region, zinc finger, CCHC-type containing protein [Tanacetum coccineum]